MATVYQLKTFADIVDAVREELKIQSNDTESIKRIKRNINMIYQQEVAPFHRWRWLNHSIDICTDAVITAGSAAVTEDSNTVTLSTAPTNSKAGYWFSVTGQSERYRVQSHTAGSSTLILETPFTGQTAGAASYKLWNDKLALPSDCRETIEITQDNLSKPLEGVGLQLFRQYVNSNAKAEGRPLYYYTGDHADPAPYSTISGLPSLLTRASSGLVKTLVFASSVEDYFDVGDKIQISGSSVQSYNGEYTVSSVSTTTLTYTGRTVADLSATADASLTVKLLSTQGDGEAYRELFVFPSIYTSRVTLHVDYVRNPLPLVEDDDEPLMPMEDRIVLVYGALDSSWARERNPEAADRNTGKFMNKLARMAGKYEDTKDKPQFVPSTDYLRTKRNMRRVRDSRYGDVIGGSSGGNTAASLSNGKIFVGNTSNNAAEVTMSGDVAIDNTGVTSIGSGVIVDADISASAAITRSKVAAGTASHVLINDGSGLLSSESALAITRGGTGQATANAALNALLPSQTGHANKFLQTDGTNSSWVANAVSITANRAAVSDGSGNLTAATTTATEIGYVNGVTSAIQTQLNGKVGTTGNETISGNKRFDGQSSFQVASSTALTVRAAGPSLTGTAQAIFEGSNASGSAFGQSTNAPTALAAVFRSNITVAAGSDTYAVLSHFWHSQMTLGAGNTITREVVFRGSSKASGGTVSNFAVLADNVTFTGDYFINSTSTNPSVLTGTLNLNGTSHLKWGTDGGGTIGEAAAARPSVIYLKGNASNLGLTIAKDALSGSSASSGISMYAGTSEQAYIYMVGQSTADWIEIGSTGGNFRLRTNASGLPVVYNVSKDGKHTWGKSSGTEVHRWNGPTQTTVGAAGGASALPATPTGYYEIDINGTAQVVPYYAKS